MTTLSSLRVRPIHRLSFAALLLLTFSWACGKDQLPRLEDAPAAGGNKSDVDSTGRGDAGAGGTHEGSEGGPGGLGGMAGMGGNTGPEPFCGDGVVNTDEEECDEPYQTGRCLPGLSCTACNTECQQVDGQMQVSWTKQTNALLDNDYAISATKVDVDDAGNVFVGIAMASESSGFEARAVVKYSASGTLEWSYLDEQRKSRSGFLIEADELGGVFLFLDKETSRHWDAQGALLDETLRGKSPKFLGPNYSDVLTDGHGRAVGAYQAEQYFDGDGCYCFRDVWGEGLFNYSVTETREFERAPDTDEEDSREVALALDGANIRVLYAHLSGTHENQWKVARAGDDAVLDLPPLHEVVADFSASQDLYVAGIAETSPALFKLNSAYALDWSYPFAAGAEVELVRTQSDGSIAVALRENGQLKVQRFDTDGTLLSTVTLGSATQSIAINAFGQIAVVPSDYGVSPSRVDGLPSVVTTQLRDAAGVLSWEDTYEQEADWDEVLTLGFADSGELYAMTEGGPFETSFSSLDRAGRETWQDSVDQPVATSKLRREPPPSRDAEFIWVDDVQATIQTLGKKGLSTSPVEGPEEVVRWGLNAQGNVYVQDWSGRVFEMGEHGGTLIHNQQEYWGPAFLMGDAGELYVGRTNAVEKWTAGNELEWTAVTKVRSVDYHIDSSWFHDGALDGQGNLYVVVGVREQHDGNGPNPVMEHYALKKVDAHGREQWDRLLDVQAPVQLVVDHFGRIFVAGGEDDCKVHQYNAAGKRIGTLTLPEGMNCRITALAVAEDGRIAIGGSTRGSLYGDEQSGSQDAFWMMLE